MAEHELLTLKEAAELLRRTPQQMRWLRHTGKGPKSAVLGGRVFYRRSDCERWVSDAFERESAKAS